MGRTYRYEKEWGRARPKKTKKGKAKQKPLTINKNQDHQESKYYDDLEVEAYEKDLQNRKRYTKD